MKQGRIAIEIMVMLIAVVVTSGVILFLVQSGMIEVKGAAVQQPILNAEFIPVERGGFLTINEFQFCGDVDDNFKCVNPKTIFETGDEVHFRFIVETNPFNGEIMLVENYRLSGPNEEILLDVNAEDNFHFNQKSDKPMERIPFADYFTLGDDEISGEYTLDLVMMNNLINKRAVIRKQFEVR